MSELSQSEFKGWAKVEVMGHQTHIGFTTTEVYGAAVMFRVDQPEVPEAEEILEHSGYAEGHGYCPSGSVVKRAKIEAASVLVGAGSIYRITPCTEEAALAAIRATERRPLILVKLPEMAAIAAAPERDYDLQEAEDF